MTKPGSPGFLSVTIVETWGWMEEFHKMLTLKVPGTAFSVHVSVCLHCVLGSVPQSKTDVILTCVVFSFEWLNFKFKPLFSLILVLLCRVIDIFLMAKYIVNFNRTNSSHDSNLISTISTQYLYVKSSICKF